MAISTWLFQLSLVKAKASTSVSSTSGDGNGKFTAGQTITAGSGPHSAAAADFNGDGHVDLAVTNRDDDMEWFRSCSAQVYGTFASHATIPIAVVPGALEA